MYYQTVIVEKHSIRLDIKYSGQGEGRLVQCHTKNLNIY